MHVVILLLACKISLATLTCTPQPIPDMPPFVNMKSCKDYAMDALGADEITMQSFRYGIGLQLECARRA